MKKIILMLLILAAPICSITHAQQKVAIYIGGDINQGYKKVIGAKMVSSITQGHGYSAIERTNDFLAALTQELDYQMSGAVSNNQIAKIGSQFGVNYVIVADASEVFGEIYISARMIDVVSAQIIVSTETSGKIASMDNLTGIAKSISDRLMSEVTSLNDPILREVSWHSFSADPIELKEDLECARDANINFVTDPNIAIRIIKAKKKRGETIQPIIIDFQDRLVTFDKRKRGTQYFTAKYVDTDLSIKVKTISRNGELINGREYWSECHFDKNLSFYNYRE